MAIIETRIKSRQSTDVPFFNQTNLLPTNPDGSPTVAHLIAEGKYNREMIYSDDGLTETTITTHQSLESLSEADTLLTIELDALCWDYIVEQPQNGQTANSYVLSGIDQPFTITIRYTFPSEIAASPTMQSLVTEMQNSTNFMTPKTVNAVVGTDHLELVYKYDDCNDYKNSWVNDMPWVTRLHAVGATRTIKYQYA